MGFSKLCCILIQNLSGLACIVLFILWVAAPDVSYEKNSFSQSGFCLTQVSAILLNQLLSNLEAFWISWIINNNPSNRVQSKYHLILLVNYSVTEVEYFFTLLNLADGAIHAMKNKLDFNFFLVRFSKNVFEFVILIVEITNDRSIYHGSYSSVEPHVAYLHVQVYFVKDCDIIPF